MKREYELVQHPQISSMNIFLVRVDYRTPHAHMEIEIGIVLEGVLQISTNREKVILRAGDIYYLNPMDFHELISEDGSALILAIQISECMLSPYFPNIRYLHVENIEVQSHFSNLNS